MSEDRDEETLQDETPEEFREQPGDREPEGEVAEEVAAEEEVEEEAEAEEEVAEEVEAQTEEEDPEPERKKDWRDRQIAKLREREKARDTELAEIRARAEAAEALLAATPEEREGGLTESARETIRKEEAEKVRKEAWGKRVGDNLDTMYAAGAKQFGKTWESRVAETAEVFGAEMRSREDFLEALGDLPNNAVVYNDLMADPDRLESLLKMPAHKMGAELARLSDRLAAPKKVLVSKAPKPIVPIERGGQERDLEDLINDPKASMAEIDRRMAAEEKKRAKAH